MIRILVIFSLLALGGCDWASWVSYGNTLQQRGMDYVDDRHRIRQEIRRRCEELLWSEIDRLESEGREDEARTLLAVNYPGLLTFDAVRAYRAGELDTAETPWGCEVTDSQ